MPIKVNNTLNLPLSVVDKILTDELEKLARHSGVLYRDMKARPDSQDRYGSVGWGDVGTFHTCETDYAMYGRYLRVTSVHARACNWGHSSIGKLPFTLQDVYDNVEGLLNHL